MPPVKMARIGYGTHDRTLGWACRAHDTTCDTHKVTPPRQRLASVYPSGRDCDNVPIWREPRSYLMENFVLIKLNMPSFGFQIAAGALSSSVRAATFDQYPGSIMQHPTAVEVDKARAPPREGGLDPRMTERGITARRIIGVGPTLLV